MSETLPALATRTPADLIAWGRTAIEEAASFIAVKEIRDQAEALRAYQRSVGAAQEAVNAAQEIRVRAERRMGQEIAKAQHEGSAATPHRRKKGSPSVTLSEISVTKRQSSEWQQLAAVDDETFDAALRTAREKGKLSLSAVRGLLKPPPVDRKAKAKSGKVRSKRRVPQEPNAEEMARSRLTQFFMNTKHYAQLIGELGTPEEVIERTTKAAKGKERRLFDQAEFYRIDPATLYRIADFLTAVARAAEDAAL